MQHLRYASPTQTNRQARMTGGPKDRFARWIYRGGHPNVVGRTLNRGWAWVHAMGIWPSRLATLEVVGRTSGRAISFPVVIAEVEERRYLVAMLGAETNWVKNVEAADGRAVLRHGRREEVTLEAVPVALRAPVVLRYSDVAPGGRPHLALPADATAQDLERLCARVPVFQVAARRERGG